MKFNKICSVLGLLTASLVNASRSDFYGENDNRPKLFKILDDHIGTLKINLDADIWATMKEKTLLEPWDAGSKGEKYGTDNATLEFFVEGTDYRVNLGPGDFNFVLGGKFTRNFAKPGYNIKIENGSLFDVKFLRIRSSYRDPTLMREKLSSDFLTSLGIPVTSTNYINVEVNGENLGIYLITNKVKKDFIKKYFGDKNTTSLYECKNDGTRFENNGVANGCENIKEELINQKDEIQAFNDAVMNAKTIDDIKDLIDIESFLKSICFEFFTISWDLYLVLQHNYFWYKKPDGKWTLILNDFDETWGLNVWNSMYRGENTEIDKYADKSYIPQGDDIVITNFLNFSIRDCDMGHKLIKLLVYDNEAQWREIVGEVVKKVFNPKVLYPRIDELSELIRDDFIVSHTVQPETGRFLGVFNTVGFDPKWNVTHFDENSNFVNWANNPDQARGYGLKYLIQERFRYLCHTYGIDPETLELIQPQPAASYWSIINKYPFYWGEGELFGDEYITWSYPDIDKEDFMQESYNADPINNSKPKEYVIRPTVHEDPEAYANVNASTTTVVDDTTATTTVASADATAVSTNGSEVDECWSEALGYPCCTESCVVYATDDSGSWGYENQHWCGITSSCAQEKCWSKKFGYNCCSGCHAYETDENGKWGYENNSWCGIIEENCN